MHRDPNREAISDTTLGMQLYYTVSDSSLHAHFNWTITNIQYSSIKAMHYGGTLLYSMPQMSKRLRPANES